MKTKLCLLTLTLLWAYQLNANTYLRNLDPRQAWRNEQGTIDTAILSIKPHGAYLEYGLYLTFSAHQYSSQSDTLEVQLKFDLPKGSIVTDSWLWVGNQIVQAMITDRNRATMVYESIVQRRQDPSILYKDSETQYELRIFPMAGNQTRKVKLTYLVPLNWKNTSVTAQLPTNILKASRTTPHFRILSYTDTDWQKPGLGESPQTAFSPSTGTAYTHTLNATAFVSAHTELNYTLNSPLKDGIYATSYETGSADGYYQLVVVPSKVFNINITRKAAILFDYEPGLSGISPNDILTKGRQLLHDYFSATDSFNLFFSQLNTLQVSNVWLPCDSLTIENTFNALNGNPISNITNVGSLLGTAIDFIKLAGGTGELILLTNTDDHKLPTIANPIINAVITKIGQHHIPIHSLLYANQNLQSTWVNNKYYTADEYLLDNLAIITGGNFVNLNMQNGYYYSNDFKSLEEGFTELGESLNGTIGNFELRPTMNNGFCYAKYGNNTGSDIYLNKPYIQTGKYFGNLPMNIEFTGILQGAPFQQSITVTNVVNADSTLRKIWVGNYIQQMENSNPDNAGKYAITESSIKNRVLSLYTAFLALEPSDTISACNTCVDETNTGGPSVGINEQATDSLSIVALPNPFAGNVQIQLQLPQGTTQARLTITNLLGQAIFSYQPELTTDTNRYKIDWNGTNLNGEQVSAGMYLVVLQTDKGRQTLKLMKQ